MVNEKSLISRHYKEVREIISQSLRDANVYISTRDDEENKFFEEIKECLSDQDKVFKQEIDGLEKISDWNNFCISFFGETNAGKSTIIETLRIIYDEESRRKKIQKNNSGFRVFLRKSLLKMGFKAGTKSRLARFLSFNGNTVDGDIIGNGRADFTKDVTGYNLYYNGKPFILYDVPGIEGDESKFEQVIQKAVDKAHLIFYVNGTSKKIEPGTAEKLKKYLKNYTDVYAIINVHCPPKKNRDVEIDDPYSEELQREYSKMEPTIKKQTDEVLHQVLAENYKESKMLNGLSAFCAYAYDESTGLSTIIPDNSESGDKKLLNEKQQIFFMEYNNDLSVMKSDSRIHEITDIISKKAENFVPDIVESNKKKLLARLDDSSAKIKSLQEESIKASKKFIEQYKQMIKSSREAMENFSYYVRNNYVVRVVSRVVDAEKEKFFDFIDEKDGKIKKEDYQRFFDSRRDELEAGIQTGLKDDMEKQVGQFKDAIMRAQERFEQNIESFFQFSQVDFPALQDVDFSVVSEQMKYTLKNFGSDALNVGGFAISGGGVGFALGGPIGAMIGAAIGAVVGLIASVISFFQGRDKRIAKAKEKASEVFNDIKSSIIHELKNNAVFEEYVEEMESVTENITEKCESQISQFEEMGVVLNNLVTILSEKQRNIKEMPYGKI